MTIRSKLAISFTATMALFTINVVIYFLSDSRRQDTFQDVLDAIERQKLINAVSRNVDSKIQQIALLNSILADAGGSPASPDQVEQFNRELAGITQNIHELRHRSSGDERQDAEQLLKLFARLRRTWEVFYSSFGVDPSTAIMAMDAEPISPLLQQVVVELAEKQERQVQKASLRFAEIQGLTRRITLGIFAISLTLAIGIAGWISRHITVRLAELREGAENIGAGRLASRISVSSEDELGQLGERFNDMAEKLQSSRSRLEATTEQLRQLRDHEQVYVNRLAGAMNVVEKGDYDQRLAVSGNDVWTGLYRGFNLMTEGLRDEAQILKVAQDLSGELQIDALIERIMRATTELLDADRSSLFLYDPKTNELWSRCAEGLQTKEVPFPASEGIAGSVLTSGELLNVSDPYNRPDFNPAMDRETGYRTENILCMPITNKIGESIGVTQVLNKRGGAFTRRDEARLRGLSSQVAVSVENAQLFEDVLNIKNYNESILHSSSNGLITLDTERSVVTANNAALAILGASRDSLLGQPASGFFRGSNEWVMESIFKVEKTGQTDISVDAGLERGAGHSAAVNLTAVPLLNVAGEPIGTLLMIEDLTREQRIKTTMARYMSQQVVDRLLESGEGHLEGETKRVSILFADVRKFTNMAEAIGAKETVTLLNDYFEVMVDIIFRCGGILDKYIGDAIMALFGAPFESPQDADHVVEVATEMLVALRGLNDRFRAVARQPLRIGIGVGTGEVVAGSIGSSKRMEYTVIGDSVNLASRLESANKFYGTQILLSGQTVADLKGSHLLREVDLIRVLGKARPVAVFEALGYHTEESFPHLSETLGEFGQGLEEYRRREWRAAVAHFEAALRANPDDAPSKIYVNRCLQNSEKPPPADWDGVWELQTK